MRAATYDWIAPVVPDSDKNPKALVQLHHGLSLGASATLEAAVARLDEPQTKTTATKDARMCDHSEQAEFMALAVTGRSIDTTVDELHEVALSATPDMTSQDALPPTRTIETRSAPRKNTAEVLAASTAMADVETLALEAFEELNAAASRWRSLKLGTIAEAEPLELQSQYDRADGQPDVNDVETPLTRTPAISLVNANDGRSPCATTDTLAIDPDKQEQVENNRVQRRRMRPRKSWPKT